MRFWNWRSNDHPSTHDVMSFQRELRHAFRDAVQQRASRWKQDATEIVESNVAFVMQLAFMRGNEYLGEATYCVGSAKRILGAAVLPRAGDWLTGVGRWVEPPLADCVRVHRVEIHPVPNAREISKSSVTVVANVVLADDVDLDGLIVALLHDGWTPEFPQHEGQIPL